MTSLPTPAPRSIVRDHPIAAFLVLVAAFTAVVEVFPAPDWVHGSLENVLGAAVPALIVTALVGGRVGVREFLARCLRWRVRLRWYAVALVSLPLVVLVLAPLLYGTAPLHALADNWPLILTSFLPTLAVLVVLDNVAEEAGWTGFLFDRLQGRWTPMRAALLSAVPFWIWHFVSFVHDTGSWLDGLALAGYLLLPLVASRLVIGWLYNASGASVLIAGLFHATHNATVNPTGFAVAVLGLPQGEVLFVVSCLVLLAAVVIAIVTRGRLGLTPDGGDARRGEIVASR